MRERWQRRCLTDVSGPVLHGLWVDSNDSNYYNAYFASMEGFVIRLMLWQEGKPCDGNYTRTFAICVCLCECISAYYFHQS